MSLAENLGTFGRDRIARESGEVFRSWHTAQMLIVLAGLPGTGKTSLARELAAQLGAVHLRIDAIETVLHRVGIWSDEHPAAAYEIAAELADDQLRHGLAVIIDAVNPVPQDRRAWRDLAARRGVTLVAAELACADAVEHRRRVEGRAPDLKGQMVPSWREVVEREYVPWDDDDVLHLDAAKADDHVGAITVRVRSIAVSKRGTLTRDSDRGLRAASRFASLRRGAARPDDDLQRFGIPLTISRSECAASLTQLSG